MSSNNIEKNLIQEKIREILNNIKSGKEIERADLNALANLERRLIQLNKKSGKDQEDER